MLLVDRVPSRAMFQELRAYVAGGGRDLEFRIGPRIAHEAVLENRSAAGGIRVEVTGSQLVAVRLPDAGASIMTTSPRVHPTSYSGAIDWEAGVVRGSFDSSMQSSAKRRVPLLLVLAAVAGVLIGLIHWYVGVIAFVVIAALFWGLNRVTAGGKGFARIVATDLWQFAVLIGSPEIASRDVR